MKQYKVWIHVEGIDEDHDIYEDIGECYSAGCFETEAAARDYIESELLSDRVGGSATDLLNTCKTLTSYSSDLLRQLDNRIDPSNIEEIRQAKNVIAKYRPLEMTPRQFQVALQEQSPTSEPSSLMLHLLSENGQLWIRPQGYGEKCTEDGQGSPVGMEIREDRLRLIVFGDINREDPRIIDLEDAKESARK